MVIIGETKMNFTVVKFQARKQGIYKVRFSATSVVLKHFITTVLVFEMILDL